MKTEDSQKQDDAPNGGAGRDCPPAPGSGWTRTPPTKAGYYWHWCADPDHVAEIVQVGYSVTDGKCFIAMPSDVFFQDVNHRTWNGWWLEIPQPDLPNDKEEATSHE